MYDRRMALRVAERRAGARRLRRRAPRPSCVRASAARYDLDVVVSERALPLPEALSQRRVPRSTPHAVTRLRPHRPPTDRLAPVDRLAAYVALARWSGGHRMTIYTWARRRRFPRLPAPEARYFDVAPDARVLAHCYWQPAPRATRRRSLALHGLEGSSSAHYMRGLADKAFARGFNVVLLNQRNCGGTEALSAGALSLGPDRRSRWR